MKIELKNIISNGFWLTLENIIGKVIFLFLAIYLARFLGAEVYGSFSFIASFLFFFTVLADFGFGPLIIREVAREKIDRNRLFSISIVTLLLVVVSFLILIALLFIVDLDNSLKLFILYFSIYQIFHIPINHVRNIFRGLNSTFFDFLIYTFVNLLIIFFLLLGLNKDLFQIISAYNLAILLGSIFTYYILEKFYIKKYIKKGSLLFDFKYIKIFLKESFPLFLTIIATAIYFKIDLVMLGFLRGPIEVANYNVSYNFIFGITSFLFILMESVYPIMSKTRHNENKTYNTFLQILLLASLAISSILIISGDNLIELFFGNGYQKSALILNILLISLPLWSINKFFGYYLTAHHKQKHFTLIIIAGAVFNLISNYWFISAYGPFGAAITTVITEFLICLFVFSYIKINKLNLKQKMLQTILFISSLTSLVYVIWAKIFLL